MSNKQSQAQEGRLLVNPCLLLFFAEASVPGISGMILLEKIICIPFDVLSSH
jgi:hypothetical protein